MLMVWMSYRKISGRLFVYDFPQKVLRWILFWFIWSIQVLQCLLWIDLWQRLDVYTVNNMYDHQCRTINIIKSDDRDSPSRVPVGVCLPWFLISICNSFNSAQISCTGKFESWVLVWPFLVVLASLNLHETTTSHHDQFVFGCCAQFAKCYICQWWSGHGHCLCLLPSELLWPTTWCPRCPDAYTIRHRFSTC